MYKKILKISKLKDEKNKYDKEKIGYLSSIIAISLNLFIAILKFIIGFFTFSISVMVDGINNFFDAICSFFTSVAFKLSKKPQDEEHPFGHGRVEYITTLIISIIIIFVGFQFLKTSIEKFFNVENIKINSISIIFLIISIIIKLWLYCLNKKLFKKTNSNLLKAISLDSLTDALITFCCILSLIFSKYTKIHIDSILGILISCIILHQGFLLSKDTIDDLLGKAPKKELVHKVIMTIKNHKEILGVHNFNIHTYGNNKKIATVDVEVFENMSVNTAHSLMSMIEKEVFEKYEIVLITHIEPFRKNLTEDEIKLKEILEKLKTQKNFIKSIHDFEINNKNNFVSIQFVLDGKKLKKDFIEKNFKNEIEKIIKQYNKNLKTIITILYEYI